jgi:hypothetical protein
MTKSLMRRQVVLLAVALMLVLPSCVSRRVDVPPFIPPTRDASLSQLIEIVNQRDKMLTFTAKADLQFETSEGAETGSLRRFRSAQGRIILARPESIRLQIEAPLLLSSRAVIRGSTPRRPARSRQIRSSKKPDRW